MRRGYVPTFLELFVWTERDRGSILEPVVKISASMAVFDYVTSSKTYPPQLSFGNYAVT